MEIHSLGIPMTFRSLTLACTLLPASLGAQRGRGPYARIATLRPHDGQSTEFEAGYLRHLEWHRRAGDTWTWYGYSIWAGNRSRWFVYATFGHSATSFDSLVAPAEDERDNVLNVAPHVEWVDNAVYEFLPALSRGTGVPAPTARLEFTSVELVAGGAKTFEAALTSVQSRLQSETLWFRMVAGGASPRYVRLRPRNALSDVFESREQSLPEAVSASIAKLNIEIWTLRPAMSLGLDNVDRN
jgi:hypothetical protein